jgi:RNA-directed DNA polymerase
VKYRAGNRPVFITGIGVIGAHLIAPNSLNLRIKASWQELNQSNSPDEIEASMQKLLSQLGTIRHIVGPSSPIGMKAANQMHMLRQKRAKLQRAMRPAKQQPSDLKVSKEQVPF